MKTPSNNFLAALQDSVGTLYGYIDSPVFRTDFWSRPDAYEEDGKTIIPSEVKTPWSVFFNQAMQDAGLQPWNCSCCNAFLNKVAGLVTVDMEGNKHSLVWDVERMRIEDEAARQVCAVMKEMVESSGSITSRWIADPRQTIGVAMKGNFEHLYFPAIGYNMSKEVDMWLGNVARYTDKTNQKTVNNAEVNFNRLTTLRNDWTNHVEFLEKALAYLNMVGDNTFALKSKIALLDTLTVFLKETAAFKDRNRADALTWRFAASFNEQKATWKDTVLGNFLELALEKSFEDAWRQLSANLRTDVYQVGTTKMEDMSKLKLQQAKRDLIELGYDKSFDRIELPREEFLEKAFWISPYKPEAAVDGDEAISALDLLDATEKTIDEGTDLIAKLTAATKVEKTYTEFLNTVLPTAKRLWLDTSVGFGSIGFMTTAKHMDAKPMLAWDTEENRNPVAWFLLNRYAKGYPKPISAFYWTQVFPVPYQEVKAIAKLPCEWTADQEWAEKNNLGGLAFDFNMDGLVNPIHTGLGVEVYDNHPALFPAMMKSDLNPRFNQIIGAMNEKMSIGFNKAYGFFTTRGDHESMPQYVVETAEGFYLKVRISNWQ